MSGPEVELHRPVPTDRIPVGGQMVEVKASADECNAVARRMGIPGVDRLQCRFTVTRPLQGKDGEIVAEGWLRARLKRECVVSLEVFGTEVEERFRVRFVPLGTASEADDPESDDEIEYDGAAIDLGEAAVEQLALTLDPYPRKPGAALPESATDLESGPFAGLARLVRPS
jgi:uncharacterized metal-binding protein YceD (DUF177 family)